jgi:hypothetical protein
MLPLLPSANGPPFSLPKDTIACDAFVFAALVGLLRFVDGPSADDDGARIGALAGGSGIVGVGIVMDEDEAIEVGADACATTACGCSCSSSGRTEGRSISISGVACLLGGALSSAIVDVIGSVFIAAGVLALELVVVEVAAAPGVPFSTTTSEAGSNDTPAAAAGYGTDDGPAILLDILAMLGVCICYVRFGTN